MTNLLKRIFRPVPPAEGLRFRVYTRENCGCCHKAIDLLRDRQRRHRFAVELVDVDDDPALASLHGESVPVVELDGKVRFRGVVNPVLLDRLLANPSVQSDR